PLDPGHAGDGRGMHRLLPLARLGAGISLDQADAEMKAIAARLEGEYPETNTDRSARVEPITETVVGNARAPLLMLFGAALVVLLIAAVNVANLLLARAAPRSREVAVRAALGAGRGRLARQFLTESLVLSLLGGVLGVGLAFLGVKLLLAAAPAGLPRLDEVSVDPRVLLFALGLSVATGLACGLLPALSASKLDLNSSLKEGAGHQSAGRRQGRWSDVLVVFEVAFAVLLVGAAGLLLRSFVELRSVDAGFHEDQVVAVPLSLRGDTFNPERVLPFYDEIRARVEQFPGVEAVALGFYPPLAGGWETSFDIPQVHERPEGQRPEARIRPVTPGYFRTVGIPLLRGREFDERDVAEGPGVVIINESFARTFFEGRDVLAHSVRKGNWWGEDRPNEYRIVGVVGDVKMDGMAEATPWAMYFLHDQWPFSDMYLFVRTAGDPHPTIPAIRDAVWALEPQMPVENVQTFAEMRSEAVAEERFQTLLVVGFAGLALVLACVGVFGVLSHAVAQRRGEIAIRMAVGARAADVVRSVIGKGARLVALGVALGLAVAFGVTRFIRSLLFEVSPTEPTTLAAATLLLAVVALSACAIPAFKASRQDPLRALRME
ncbi:MAG: ADOP family duplicated permease, partial [Gemmatimonadota bacterium]